MSAPNEVRQTNTVPSNSASANGPDLSAKGDGHFTRAAWARAILGVFAIVGWLAIFTSGITIGTTSFMQDLDPDNPKNLPPTLGEFAKYNRLMKENRLPPLSNDQLYIINQVDMQSLLAEQAPDPSNRVSEEKDGNRAMPERLLNTSVKTIAGKPVFDGQGATPLPPELESRALLSNGSAAGGEQLPASSNPALLPGSNSNSGSSHAVSVGAGDGFLPNRPANKRSGLENWLGVFFCNTIVNLGILSCLASIVGGLYYATLNPKAEAADKYGPEWYFMSATQGFVMYLAVLAGLLMIGDVPVRDVTSQKYIHLAGFVSVLSFWAGYTPSEFFIKLVGSFVRGTTERRDATTTATSNASQK